jgi:hypothetical protein
MYRVHMSVPTLKRASLILSTTNTLQAKPPYHICVLGSMSAVLFECLFEALLCLVAPRFPALLLWDALAFNNFTVHEKRDGGGAD